jgi:hypothetical protein
MLHYPIKAKNFVILAKFCCHPEGIFLYVVNSQHEGRFLRNDNSANKFICNHVLRHD